MSEQHPQEPTPISETVENRLDEVVGFTEDPERQRHVRLTDLQDEQNEIRQRIDDLWQEMQAGRAGPDAQERLDELKQTMVAIDADLIDARRQQGGNPPQ